MDEKGVKITIRNGVCYLTDRRNGVTFANIVKRPNDGFFTTILLYSRQSAANNAYRSNEDQRCKMGTISVRTAAHLYNHILGHSYMSVINTMMKARRYGMSPSDVTKTHDFLSCTQPKHTRSRCKGTIVM